MRESAADWFIAVKRRAGIYPEEYTLKDWLYLKSIGCYSVYGYIADTMISKLKENNMPDAEDRFMCEQKKGIEVLKVTEAPIATLELREEVIVTETKKVHLVVSEDGLLFACEEIKQKAGLKSLTTKVEEGKVVVTKENQASITCYNCRSAIRYTMNNEILKLEREVGIRRELTNILYKGAV